VSPSITGGAEYAVVEHFPARGTNEIWNRGWNAVEVLKAFAQEQRQALQIWTEDMTAQVKGFLGEISRPRLSRVTVASCTVSPRTQLSHRQTHRTEKITIAA